MTTRNPVFEIPSASAVSWALSSSLPNRIPVLRRCFGETRYRLFRNQEHMNRRLWIDIVKNDQVVIFRDDLGRNLARNNFFETVSSDREEDIGFHVGSFKVCPKEIDDFVS